MPTGVHLRRSLSLKAAIGRRAARCHLFRFWSWATYDAAYVENLLLAERRAGCFPHQLYPLPSGVN